MGRRIQTEEIKLVRHAWCKGKRKYTTLGKSGPRKEDFIRSCESFFLAQTLIYT